MPQIYSHVMSSFCGNKSKEGVALAFLFIIKVFATISADIENICKKQLYKEIDHGDYAPAGLIDKLQFFLEILSENEQFSKADQKMIDNTFKQLHRDIEDDFPNLSYHLKSHLKNLSKMLLDPLTVNLKNESVLVSLMQLKENLSPFIEKDQVDNILLKAFPGGMAEIEDFIQKKHSVRGFYI